MNIVKVVEEITQLFWKRIVILVSPVSWTLPPLILPAYIYVPFPSAIHFTLQVEAA